VAVVSRSPKIAFVYPNSRIGLAADVAAGVGADSFLLGQNHLGDHGFDAYIHEPHLRAPGESGIIHQLRWNLREAVIPWELGDADIVVSTLANLLPASARVRRRPNAVILDFALSTLLDRRRGLTRRLFRSSLESAAAIVCLSATQRARLLERVSLDPARVHVVPLGIDHEFFRPLVERRSVSPFVFAVGKDLARDYRTLANAAARIDAPFVVVTERRNSRSIDFPVNVKLRHGLSYAELRDLYASAACVVVPLRRANYLYGTESGGLTALMEAMAMARPLVASDRPIIREYVDHGDSGLLVPPEEPEPLASAINRILDEPELASRLGRSARAVVERRHTMSHFAAGLASVFADLTRPRGSSSDRHGSSTELVTSQPGR
jgi:glycosyltransferase involved in cell wall biosynthesis